MKVKKKSTFVHKNEMCSPHLITYTSLEISNEWTRLYKPIKSPCDILNTIWMVGRTKAKERGYQNGLGMQNVLYDKRCSSVFTKTPMQVLSLNRQQKNPYLYLVMCIIQKIKVLDLRCSLLHNAPPDLFSSQ